MNGSYVLHSAMWTLTLISISGCSLVGPSIRKTRFDTGWESVRLESVGVEIELPKEPQQAALPTYIISEHRQGRVARIEMHLSYIRSQPTGGVPLLIVVLRSKRELLHRLIEKDQLIWAASTFDADLLFSEIQRNRVPDTPIWCENDPDADNSWSSENYRWEFVKCYKTPGDDVIIVTCLYSIVDSEDLPHIERMINSVRPYR